MNVECQMPNGKKNENDSMMRNGTNERLLWQFKIIKRKGGHFSS
jgi:hypothetical protein